MQHNLLKKSIHITKSCHTPFGGEQRLPKLTFPALFSLQSMVHTGKQELHLPKNSFHSKQYSWSTLRRELIFFSKHPKQSRDFHVRLKLFPFIPYNPSANGPQLPWGKHRHLFFSKIKKIFVSCNCVFPFSWTRNAYLHRAVNFLCPSHIPNSKCLELCLQVPFHLLSWTHKSKSPKTERLSNYVSTNSSVNVLFTQQNLSLSQTPKS